MRRLLLFGRNGQLGWELQRTLATLGEVVAFDFPEVDLAKPETLRKVIRQVSPQIIINAAAYTNVDKAESEPELAMKVNGDAPGVMAEEAQRLKAGFIHYSTDYVFDGRKGSPYVETDLPNPINTYGKTKLAGELKVQEVGSAYLIFRTSWVYSLRQGGFVTKVLQWAKEQENLRIVDDQIGSPTWARTLAEGTSQIIAQGRGDTINFIKEVTGLYNFAGGGAASRFEWARAIIDFDPEKSQHKLTSLQRSKTSEFPTPANRPHYSALNCQKFEIATSFSIPYWMNSISLLFPSRNR